MVAGTIMLIFIENTPRAYAWGSTDALPELLGRAPDGTPQAELWLGAHPGDPATLAKATPEPHSLIDLIDSDPDRYGFDGGPLPFLTKVLAIGAPLSLQVHPDRAQAQAGFAREEAARVPLDAPERNYGDANHKPELLVALTPVTALSGFRDLGAAAADFAALAALARVGAGAPVLRSLAERCAAVAGEPESGALRAELLPWLLGGGDDVALAVEAAQAALEAPGAEAAIHAARLTSLRQIAATHPGDPGLLISVLLHLVELAPGEAVFLAARQLHAYLSGVAVEVMAASDNVLRAGLTQKHVDPAEVLRVVDVQTLADPHCPAQPLAAGLTAWRPAVADFQLLRARVRDDQVTDEGEAAALAPRSTGEWAESVRIDAPYPLVLVVTSGRVRVERHDTELAEVASARRGQSLYVSAGGSIEVSGCGEVFVATAGAGWGAAEGGA